MSYYCEAHSQIHMGVGLNNIYECEAHSLVVVAKWQKADGSGLGFRFRISVRARVRVKYID